MARLTLKQVNEHLAPMGFELVRRGDYFYFTPLASNTTTMLRECAVSTVVTLNQLTLDQWVNELKEAIEEHGYEVSDNVKGTFKLRLVDKPDFSKDYENTLPYPSKETRYIMYSDGSTILDTTNHDEFLRKKRDHPAAPWETKRLNTDQYNQQRKEYNDESDRLLRKFKEDLFAYHGVTNNPKRERCFELAWDYGHSSGKGLVAQHFEELVTLIKD